MELIATDRIVIHLVSGDPGYSSFPHYFLSFQPYILIFPNLNSFRTTEYISPGLSQLFKMVGRPDETQPLLRSPEHGENDRTVRNEVVYIFRLN